MCILPDICLDMIPLESDLFPHPDRPYLAVFYESPQRRTADIEPAEDVLHGEKFSGFDIHEGIL